jgi:small subunit ribosomal protein S11
MVKKKPTAGAAPPRGRAKKARSVTHGRTQKARARKKGGKKRERREVRTGVAHVQATFNNTIVTLTDKMGNVVSWSSAGSAGFKGSRKSTPFAAQTAAEIAARKAMEIGLKQIEVFVRGRGRARGRHPLAAGGGLEITAIRDVTPIPHDGCRPPKRRRV